MNPVLRKRFQAMRAPMPEIERTSLTELKGISTFPNMFEMKKRTFPHNLLHRLLIALAKPIGIFREIFQKFHIFDDRNFKCFGNSADPVDIGKRSPKIKIIDDSERRRKCAERIFDSVEIDSVFHSDTGIILSKNRRRNPNQTESAVKERRPEPDHVENRSSADRNDKRMAAKLVFLGNPTTSKTSSGSFFTASPPGTIWGSATSSSSSS